MAADLDVLSEFCNFRSLLPPIAAVESADAISGSIYVVVLKVVNGSDSWGFCSAAVWPQLISAGRSAVASCFRAIVAESRPQVVARIQAFYPDSWPRSGRFD